MTTEPVETVPSALEAWQTRQRSVIDGIAALMQWTADHADDLPQLPMPTVGDALYDVGYVLVDLDGDAARFARLTRLLLDGADGPLDKRTTEQYMHVTRRFGEHVILRASVARSQVCRRVQIGTVTVEVPDPDAPMVTVEQPVFEWKCDPILAAES